uniref:Uncharacterized protein n=1 Tax=Vitrella brassicaformis TaxID=1169539 RepID=A0A7S1P264_9ALVE
MPPRRQDGSEAQYALQVVEECVSMVARSSHPLAAQLKGNNAIENAKILKTVIKQHLQQQQQQQQPQSCVDGVEGSGWEEACVVSRVDKSGGGHANGGKEPRGSCSSASKTGTRAVSAAAVVPFVDKAQQTTAEDGTLTAEELKELQISLDVQMARMMEEKDSLSELEIRLKERESIGAKTLQGREMQMVQRTNEMRRREDAYRHAREALRIERAVFDREKQELQRRVERLEQERHNRGTSQPNTHTNSTSTNASQHQQQQQPQAMLMSDSPASHVVSSSPSTPSPSLEYTHMPSDASMSLPPASASAAAAGGSVDDTNARASRGERGEGEGEGGP